MESTKRYKAVSTIEVILAVALLSIVGLSIYNNLSTRGRERERRNMFLQAVEIGQSDFEVVKELANNNLSQFADGTYYVDRTTQWELSATPVAQGIYTNQLVVSTEYENGDEVIKKVTSTVSWETENITTEIQLSSWDRVSVLASWANPAIDTAYQFQGNYDPICVEVVGNVAFLVDAINDVLAAINITDYQNIVEIGSVGVSGDAYDLAIMGQYALISSSSNTAEFQVYSISNPASMTLVSSLNLTGNSNGLDLLVNGNYAYISRTNGSAEVQVIDMTNPASPAVVADINLSGDINSLARSGNYLYLAADDNAGELKVYNISTPSTPVYVTQIDLPGNNNAEVIHVSADGYLYLSRADGTLYTYDISNPASPSQISSIAMDNTAYDLDSTTGLLFYAEIGQNSKIDILDVSTPSSPVVFGSYPTNGSVQSIDYIEGVDRLAYTSLLNANDLTILKPN